ncbi:structure-specific endonuclease subunit slx4, partial [Plakobranchus ocellatus]
KAVQKIGVKPLAKKRNIQLLKEVYHQTHQYETDSDYEPTPKKCPRVDTLCEERTNACRLGGAISGKIDEKQRITTLNGTSQSSGSAASSVCFAKAKSAALKSGDKVDDGDDVDDADVPQSQDSSSSEGPDLPEESILQGWPEEELASPQMLTQTSEEILVNKFLQFVHSNVDIHEDILLYKPLELDVLKKKIVAAGIKMSMPKLMDILDERCITFTMKNMSTRNNRHQRQPKKKVSTQPKP